MLRRLLLSTAAAAMLSFAAGPAMALSLDDIKEMAAVGVPDSIIVQTIGNSAEVFSLSATEITELKRAGISDDVIQALVDTSSSQTRTAPTREPEPERTTREDDKSSRRSEGDSTSRRRRADDSSTRRRASDDDEGLVRRRGDHRGRSRQGDDGNKSRRKKIKRTPAEIRRYITAVKERKYERGALGLYRVLESSKYPEHNVKVAFYLGTALYQMKLYHSAQQYFDMVVKEGPGAGAYYSKSLANLVYIADQTHDPIYLIKKVVSKIDPDDYPNTVRDDLYYYQAVRNFEGEDLKSARRNFGKVAPQSEKYLQARYYMGVIYNKEGKQKRAVQTFDSIIKDIRAGKVLGEPQLRADIAQLSLIGIARIYYAVGQYKQSRKYYGYVDRDAAQWPVAHYETAWANFMAEGRENQALGNILTVTSPFFDDLWLPEVYLLEALTYYRICEYKEVERLLNNFETRYAPVQESIDNLLKDYAGDNPRPFRDLYARLYGTRGDAWQDLPVAIFARIEANRGFAGPHSRVLQIERELASVSQARSQWRESELGKGLRKMLKKELKLYMKIAGISLANELGRVSDELGDLLGQEALLRFEVVNGEYEKWASAFRNPTLTDVNEKVEFDFATNPDLVYWPFNNEFWEDELGYYEKAEPGDCKE